jgi:phage recombination protein Bet
MTGNVVAIREQSSLALAPDQDEFTDKQISILKQLGVKDATLGDMAVFFHQCKRTGLDPFARQIYMLARTQRDGDRWVTKQTIQTGIDGYRLIARRAADAARESLEYEDNLWCGPDGQWVDVWLSDKPPAAAKAVVLRNGHRFPAVAKWTEYVQTKKDGSPTAMWTRMAANQLAKCAEAAALRKAFPQDLSGIYTDDETGPVEQHTTVTVEGPRTGTERMRAIVTPKTEGAAEAAESAPTADDPAPSDPWAGDEPPMTDRQRKRIFAQFADMGVTDEQLQRDYMSNVLGRTVTSRGELTMVEADLVAEAQRMDLLPDGRPS